MPIKKVTRQSIGDQVFEQLKEQIFNNEWKRGEKIPSENADIFDWGNLDALDFLEFLRNYEFSFYTVWDTRENWVKEADLPKLIEFLDSNEPCANVVSVLSSFIDMERSTIGNEAAYLILGYRMGKYPPGLNSTRPKLDKDEILRWFKARNAN